jgi:hypothetical protein
VSELAGADACAECHRAIYDAWKRSPHGRSMARPSDDSVRGDFAAAPMQLRDGRVSLTRDAAGWGIDLDGETRRVDLVLASGRQHQLYITRGSDGSLALLPVLWSTRTHEWLPMSLYQPGWASLDLTRGCLSCHLSQSYRRLDGATPQSAWVDLSINCESCHGPGAGHIRSRRAGSSDDNYRDLSALGREEESRVCGQCHGFSIRPYVFPRAADGLPQVFVTTLINGGLRPDGTQRSTSYQYAGHVLSACYREGALTCKGCHQPHALTPRDFIGEPAAGADSNRQCTICHRDKTADVKRHSHHAVEVRCIDCHMSYSWIGDDERRKQRTSDHSISIPRPEESLALGTPNACTTCHHDRGAEWAAAALKKWGASRALGVREWVETIALARKRAAGAGERLLRLLADEKAGHYLHASVIDLLMEQPSDARWVTALAPFADGDDVELRGLALRALVTLDATERRRWVERGLADAHPYVRMETFAAVKDPALLTAAAIERELSDTLAYKNPPTDGLVHLITVRHRRGELKEALALLDLLERVALPSERARLDLDGVRGRLRADLERR